MPPKARQSPKGTPKVHPQKDTSAKAPTRRPRKRAPTAAAPTAIPAELEEMPLAPVAEALVSTDTGTPDVDPEIQEDLMAERTHEEQPPETSLIVPSTPEADHGTPQPNVTAAPSQAEQVVSLLDALGHYGAGSTPAMLDLLKPMSAGARPVPTTPPAPPLSPEIVTTLTERWGDLQAMLDWWQERQRHVHEAGEPERQLERQTYHVERRFIALIKQEADLQQTTYAAIVNRAFEQYFGGRTT